MKDRTDHSDLWQLDPVLCQSNGPLLIIGRIGVFTPFLCLELWNTERLWILDMILDRFVLLFLHIGKRQAIGFL